MNECTFQTIRVDRPSSIATLTLCRPERKNAVSWQLIQDVIAALEQLRDADDVSVVVITGEGGHFCVGADLAADPNSRALRGHSREDDIERLTRGSQIIELLLTFPKPTVAAIDGACAGAGLSLALGTDLRIASERAVFNTAFIAAGVSGDLGSAWLLNHVLGGATARSLLLCPRKIRAAEAATIGLVTDVAVDVGMRVSEVASILAQQAPLAMAGAKQNMLEVHQPFSEYVHGEVRRMVDCARSADAREAADAFLTKRDPQFQGQ